MRSNLEESSKVYDVVTFLISLLNESSGIDHFRIIGSGLELACSHPSVPIAPAGAKPVGNGALPF